jgi:hypothetical protein
MVMGENHGWQASAQGAFEKLDHLRVRYSQTTWPPIQAEKLDPFVLKYSIHQRVRRRWNGKEMGIEMLAVIVIARQEIHRASM